MICAKTVEVITKGLIRTARTRSITALEIGCPGVCTLQVTLLIRAPVHIQIRPKIVAFRVTVDVRVADAVISGTAVARFLRSAPCPSPTGIGRLLIRKRRHGPAHRRWRWRGRCRVIDGDRNSRDSGVTRRIPYNGSE